MIRNYQLGLLYLVKLLIDADGVADEKELEALRLIKEKENIPDEIYSTFEFEVKQLKDREVYNAGIAHLHQ